MHSYNYTPGVHVQGVKRDDIVIQLLDTTVINGIILNTLCHSNQS